MFVCRYNWSKCSIYELLNVNIQFLALPINEISYDKSKACLNFFLGKYQQAKYLRQYVNLNLF